MTIDWWALGLQAVNVLILVWLLSRVFWRPVAGAIAKRQAAARDMLAAAEAANTKADAALAEVTRARADIADEREVILSAAAAAADAATRSALTESQAKSDRLLAAARLEINRNSESAGKENAAQAAELATDIAAKLLGRLNSPAVQAVFLDVLVEAIAQMPANDRAALVGMATGIDLVSATDLKDADKSTIGKAVHQALGGAPGLTFVTEPDLIAGLEIRTAHFVLHNSWRADLKAILKDLKRAT